MSVSIDGARVHFSEDSISNAPPAPERADAPPETTDSSPFERLLQGLGGTLERGERIVAGAASGYSGLDAAGLIALQAGIYRYSEAVDLTSKLVDRATNAVRTVLSGGH